MLIETASGQYRLSGPLNIEVAVALHEQGLRALRASSEGLSLDLSGVTSVDSAGLALLIDWLAWARHAGRAIRFLRPPATLLTLARLSEVDQLLVSGGEAIAPSQSVLPAAASKA